MRVNTRSHHRKDPTMAASAAAAAGFAKIAGALLNVTMMVIIGQAIADSTDDPQ